MELELLRPILAQQYGCDPSDSDVIWAYLKQKLIDYGRDRQWGLYRNTRLSMAAHLERENQSQAALSGYLEVCYLDANGPVNRGTIVDEDGSRRVGQGPDFSQEGFSYASGVPLAVVALVLTLRLADMQLADVFLEVRAACAATSRLPWRPPKYGRHCCRL
jgi:hypothetical protein